MTLLADVLGLWPAQRDIVECLRRVGTSGISMRDLNDMTAHLVKRDRALPQRSAKAVAVHIHAIRQQLGEGFIRSDPDLGYRLSDEALALLKGAKVTSVRPEQVEGATAREMRQLATIHERLAVLDAERRVLLKERRALKGNIASRDYHRRKSAAA